MKLVVICLVVLFVVYSVFVLILLFAGKKSSAKAVATFIPDCIVLFKNLMQARDVPRRYKLLLAFLIAYLALPIDIIPDFIPIAGQLDDAIVVAVSLRLILKGAGRDIIKHNWQGPEESLKVLFKIARIEYL